MPRNKIPLSDLVRDSQIETRPLGSHGVEHVLYETGRSARRRRVPKTELWTRGRQLGQGYFGTVHLQTCTDGGMDRLRAVKEVKKFVVVGQEVDYNRELEAIMKFSNDKYNHCFVSSQGWYELEDAICITMEYFELGDLQQHIDTPLRELEGREITDQILEGLTFMHENGFIHRDLKPANIMVVDKGPEWFVKIADFGISKRRHHDTSLLTMQRGTLGFAAPEVIGSTSDQSYTYPADMWSLGAMVYRILTSTMAFESMGDLFKYAHGQLKFPVGPLESRNISKRGHEFILMLMDSCPGSRGSAASARKHPWIIEPITPANGEDWQVPNLSHPRCILMIASHPGTANIEAVGDTHLSVASKEWSSDEESNLLPSHNVRARFKIQSSNRLSALPPGSTHPTIDPSQHSGQSSKGLASESDPTAKIEIPNDSNTLSEMPATKAQGDKTSMQSILVRRPAVSVLPGSYPSEEDTEEEEPDLSASSSASSSELSQSNRLLAIGTSSTREAISHASNARPTAWGTRIRTSNSPVAIEVTGTANQRPSRPKSKWGSNKNLSVLEVQYMRDIEKIAAKHDPFGSCLRCEQPLHYCICVYLDVVAMSGSSSRDRSKSTRIKSRYEDIPYGNPRFGYRGPY